MPTIHDTPEEAAKAYIIHLETAYYKWYEKDVRRNYYFWLLFQIVAIVAGFSTSILVAFYKKEIHSDGTIAALAVILPALGSLASTILVQSRVNERWQLRETGRIAFQNLVTEGRLRFAAATTSQEFTEIHQDLSKQASKIEERQSESFFAIIPFGGKGTHSGGAKSQKPDKSA